MELTQPGIYTTRRPDLPDVVAHYEDESLNVYETIPLDHDPSTGSGDMKVKEDKMDPTEDTGLLRVKEQGAVDEDEYCVPRCSADCGPDCAGAEGHEKVDRCCNEYVDTGKLH